VTGLPPLCCTTSALPAESIAFVVDLSRGPRLRRTGAAVSVLDEGGKLNLILIHVRRGVYVAMDRACTHGGAQCRFNAKRHTLHLRGTLLHGRTHGNLRTYVTKASGERVEIWLG